MVLAGSTLLGVLFLALLVWSFLYFGGRMGR